MPFAVHLDTFSGPMDLLLHVVKQKDVEIDQIDMSEVADSFLSCLVSVRPLDLEQASEYLVVAASLLEYKSKCLLPSEHDVPLDIESEPRDDSFYAELKRRLIAYEQIKNKAKELVAMPQLGVDTFAVGITRRDLDSGEDVDSHADLDSDSISLGVYFMSLLRRVGKGVAKLMIQLEPVSIREFMVQITEVCSDRKLSGFRDILSSLWMTRAGQRGGADAHSGSKARSVVVGVFISVLELIKRGIVSSSGQGQVNALNFSLNHETSAPRDLSSHEFIGSGYAQYSGPISEDLGDAGAKVIDLAAYRREHGAESLELHEENLPLRDVHHG